MLVKKSSQNVYTASVFNALTTATASQRLASQRLVHGEEKFEHAIYRFNTDHSHWRMQGQSLEAT